MRLAAYATVVATTAIIHRTNHRRGILTVVAHVVAVKLPWRTAVSLNRHTPRRFHCNRRSPRQLSYSFDKFQNYHIIL
jgi:hypothetical protein